MEIGGKPAGRGDAAALKALKWDLNLFVETAGTAGTRRSVLKRAALTAAAVLVIAAACALPYVYVGMLTAERDAAVQEADAYAGAGLDGEEAALSARLEQALARQAALDKWRASAPLLEGAISGVYDNKGGADILKLTLEGGTLVVEGRAGKGEEAAAFAERLAAVEAFETVDIREISDSEAAGYSFTLAVTLKGGAQ